MGFFLGMTVGMIFVHVCYMAFIHHTVLNSIKRLDKIVRKFTDRAEKVANDVLKPSKSEKSATNVTSYLQMLNAINCAKGCL